MNDFEKVVPRTLAESSGQDATDTVTALYAEHEKGGIRVGVDVEVSDTCTSYHPLILSRSFLGLVG